MARNVFGEVSSEFWETYAQGRAKVPPSYWSFLFDYHASHSNKFDVVNDLGCGVGIHSRCLAQRFKHVILTDPSDENLKIAKHLLSSSSATTTTGSDESVSATHSEAQDAESQFTYVRGTAEENPIPLNSLDMVFAGNSLHFTDPPVAVRKIASQLKPGGTLIATMFGFPMFRDPRVHAAWDRLVFTAVMEVRAVVTDPHFDRMLELQYTALDAIAIPEETFENVKRVKLNTKVDVPTPSGHGQSKIEEHVGVLPEPFRVGTGKEAWPRLPSQIAEDREETIYEQDEGWDFDLNLTGVKTIFESYPVKGRIKRYDEITEKAYKELEAVSEGGRFRGTWPVTIILATKKVS